MSAHEQVVSLVSKYKLNSKLKEKIDGYIDLLEEKLSAFEEVPARNLDDHSILEGVKFPINDKSFNLSASFLFKPPELHKVGSYALNCITKNEDNIFVIDLALEIPKECWQKKDHLNYVYHRKRAFYLAYIANKLQSLKNIASSVQFSFLHGDHLKPILVLTPVGKLQSFCRFNILPFAAQDKSFVFQKFSPDKCNVQSAIFDENLNLLSSPFYNSSILKDSTLHDLSENLGVYLSDKPNVLDALVLARIWLEKQGLRRKFAHVITAFTCYLLKKNSINANLSGFQVFKSILQNLISSSWDFTGIAFNSSEEEEIDFDEEDLCAQYRGHFPVVFVDVHSKLNLCHSITIDLYERLKYDAKILYGQLNQLKVNIQSIFSARIDFNLYYDYYIHVSTDCIKNNFLQNEAIFLDCGFNAIYVLCSKLIRLIKLAVGDRISLLQHKEFGVLNSWNVTSSPPYKSSVQFITIGLLINNDKAFDAITKGPLANRPEAASFRELWGEKSEIRRFQNGDIREAVYWNSNSQQEKRNIILEAIKYILNRKLPCKLKLISSTFGYVDSLLEMNNIKFSDETVVYGTGEHFLQLINSSMVTLKKYLHNLGGLSFTVVDVVGVDPSLRSTEVFPAFPVNSKPRNVQNFCNQFGKGDLDDKLKIIKPIEIVLKIEADTKLLNNVEVIQNQKYLFYYELGKVMAKSYNLVVRPTSSFVDLFFNGHVFRVIIAINKEVVIYRAMANKTKAVKTVESVEADEIEFQTQVLPAISSCLNSLNKENPSFALSCRLLKRWLSLAMVKHFYSDITLDLLVAYAYLHFEPQYPTPSSPVKGFLRVLKFIAEFDFTEHLLILNFNQSFSVDKVSDIKANFTAERQRLPVIFIVTPYDRKLSQHTRSTPNAVIVYHTKKLATAVLSSVTDSLSQFKVTDIKNYLKPNLSMFDLVIKLNTKAIFNKFEALDFPSTICIKQSLYSAEEKHAMPITDFNPVAIYLRSLKAAFHNQALFFYDNYGGRHIGVLLRPEALKMKPFKYSTVEASMLTGTSYSHRIDNVALNLQALKEDFKILGEGLVEKVVLQSNSKLLQQ